MVLVLQGCCHAFLAVQGGVLQWRVRGLLQGAGLGGQLPLHDSPFRVLAIPSPCPLHSCCHWRAGFEVRGSVAFKACINLLAHLVFQGGGVVSLPPS